MSAPLRYSTKKTPTIIGKPHRHMMETIMAAYVFPFPPPPGRVVLTCI